MRSRLAAVAALLIVVLAGFVLLLVRAGQRSGGEQFSNAVVVTGFGDDLRRGRELCSGPIARIGAIDRVRFSLATPALDPRRQTPTRLRVRLLDADGATLAGPVGVSYVPGDVAREYADARFPQLPAGAPIRVCVENAGGGIVRLWSGYANEERAGRTELDGRAAGSQPELFFYDDPVPSLLGRLPDIFERAAIWRSDALGTWTTWALALLVVLGVPALLAFALWRAAGSRDGGGLDGGEPDEQERWARFQAEVEPALAALPRVHRFAAPPVIGAADLAPLPLTVAIVGDGDGDAVAATRASLASQTHAPAEVLDGPDAAGLLGRATGEHVLLVEAGDLLAPLAVERFGQALALAPDAHALTCDLDRLDAVGGRTAPRLFPGPSPDLLLADDISGALLCVRREPALAALAQAPLEPGAWRYDLTLRLSGDGARLAHLPQLLVHRRHDAPAPDGAAQLRAAQRAVAVAGGGARVELTERGGRRVRRELPSRPAVEAIVLFRDKPELLRRCAETVLRRSTYERLTLRLVDNGSVEPETARLVAELSADPRVTAMRDDGPFNFAALNNRAVEASNADVIVFLNNDTAVLQDDWVEALLEEALRPEVGAVAPLLTYPDGSVQHAGAALGLHGYAGHPFASLRPQQQTPFGSAVDGTRNWLAVTAACTMVERSKLDAVGCFDERFVVAGNDVDLCLRLTRAGHRTLCLPHVTLLHDESQSRGSHIDPADFRRSEESYGAFRTDGDPFYNPNLTLARSTCELRAPGE